MFSLEQIVADLEDDDTYRHDDHHGVDHHRDGRPKNINSQGQTPIRTLGKIYAMCSSIGVEGTYNGIRINDFFACRDNYAEKSKGFTVFSRSRSFVLYYARNIFLSVGK